MIPLVAWEEVCKPKSEWGLRIRGDTNVNKTLITKL